MNEKELVEAVASYLTNGVCEDVAPRTDHKVVDKTEDRTVKLRGEKSASSSKTKAKSVTMDLEEESSDCSAAQESTYVSETDLDITEVETVPFTMNQQQSVPEGQRSGPAQGHTSVELDTENREDHSQRPAQVDEDDMRLVKEIFFT
ncbi:hypothetical protein JOB18_033512 [Solea senegalensis]|nr:hypothetical protein JOB18_033512 [Solea senegalensis]